MTINQIKSLALPEVKILSLRRFIDNRGYFLEVFRTDILTQHPQMPELKDKNFVQLNESRSVKGVVRGLHTQTQPNIDKLLRVISGRIIDVVVDIRLNSATFGQAVCYEIDYQPDSPVEEIIFIPFGFAHGIVALEDSQIQYLQTGFWNGQGETTLQFRDPTIDWSLCEPSIKVQVQAQLQAGVFSDKDKQGILFQQWRTSAQAQNYLI